MHAADPHVIVSAALVGGSLVLLLAGVVVTLLRGR
jgi:hypothetical protein